MRVRKLGRIGAVVGASAVFAAGVQVAIASTQGPERAAVQTQVSASLGAQRIVTRREDAATVTTSTAFTTLSSASLSVPSGQHGLIVSHFAAESLCSGNTGWCSVRILLDGVEMVPQSGIDFAFDSPGDSWESHAMERASNVVSAGVHTLTLQQAVIAGASSLRLDDWVFDGEYWRIS